MIFELFDEDTAGLRPGVLAEPRPQERVQRHTLEHIVDFVCCAPMVQILDAPVPQTLEQLPDVLQFFGTLLTDSEQVIEVPKILPEDVPMRAVLRDPQLAELLVEVPTIVSYSWLQLRMEQTVDIPVPGRGGRIAGLQGFLPRQSPTALLSSGGRISERTVEQTVDPPGGGFQDFRPGLSSSSSYFPAGVSEALDEPGPGVFRTFPQIKKKVRSRVRTRLRECPLVLAHPRRLLSSVFVSRSGSWSRMNMGSTSGTRTLERSAGSWWRAPILAGGGEMASTSTLATTDFGNVVCGSWFVVAQTVLGCCWSVVEAFGRISCSSWPLSRCSHLRIWTLPSPSGSCS